jgi:hypothetical protein
MAVRQADVQRAIRAAHAAGVVLDEVRIRPDGEIRLVPRREGAPSSAARDIQDELAAHFANARY